MNSMDSTSNIWRRCNSCKKEVRFREKYWVCNVSTCNRKRTGLIFCGVSCWDAHVPMMNHRESWAEERTAPTREEWAKILAGEDKPERKRTPKEAAPSAEKITPHPPKVILRRSSGQ